MKIGVIGQELWGSGIAQAFAQCEGYNVALCDINEICSKWESKNCKRI